MFSKIFGREPKPSASAAPKPPTREAARAEGKANPGGWVYEIGGGYNTTEAVPPQAIKGAWKVDDQGNFTGNYEPNSSFDPMFRKPGYQGESAPTLRQGDPDNRLIMAIRLELRSGTTRLPEPMGGAIMVAFCFAADPAEAATKAYRVTEKKGVLPRVLEDGFSLPVSQWRQYVEGQLAEFAPQMPAQDQIAAQLDAGEVVFGPLIGFPA